MSLTGVVVLVEEPTRPRIVDTSQLAIYREHECAQFTPLAHAPHRTETFEELAARRRAQEHEQQVRELGAEEARRQEENTRYKDNDHYQATGTVSHGPVIAHSCPECGSPPGMICFSPKRGWSRTNPHNERKWLVVEKGPSPAERRRKMLENGYGIRTWLEDEERPLPLDPEDEFASVMKTMYQWLKANGGLFDTLG